MWFHHQGLTAAGQLLELLGVGLVAYEQLNPRASDRRSAGPQGLTRFGVGTLLLGLTLELVAGLLLPP